jgi:hypothetical protein
MTSTGLRLPEPEEGRAEAGVARLLIPTVTVHVARHGVHHHRALLAQTLVTVATLIGGHAGSGTALEPA